MFLAVLALTLKCQAGRALDASDYVLLPTHTQDEREVDSRYGMASSGVAPRRESDGGLGFGLGITQRWFTELALRYQRREGSSTSLSGIEWENILQLAEPGEWPIDVAVASDIEGSTTSKEGVSVLTGPLLQREFGRLQANFNALLRRNFGNNGNHTLQIEYQAQVKYRYTEPFEFGVQAFGSLGSTSQAWASCNQQVHRLGPVVLGRVKLLQGRSISYNAAFLVGATDHSPDRTLRLQIEYEF